MAGIRRGVRPIGRLVDIDDLVELLDARRRRDGGRAAFWPRGVSAWRPFERICWTSDDFPLPETPVTAISSAERKLDVDVLEVVLGGAQHGQDSCRTRPARSGTAMWRRPAR